MISFDIEKDLYNKNIIMIGVDEAGRGSWAGPLVSTACWLDFTKYKSLSISKFIINFWNEKTYALGV